MGREVPSERQKQRQSVSMAPGATQTEQTQTALGHLRHAHDARQHSCVGDVAAGDDGELRDGLRLGDGPKAVVRQPLAAIDREPPQPGERRNAREPGDEGLGERGESGGLGLPRHHVDGEILQPVRSAAEEAVGD